MLCKHTWAWILPLICSGCGDSSQPRQYQIASSSMAPFWAGPQRSASCSHCPASFPIAAETYSPSLPTRCYACGGVCTVSQTIEPGSVVRLLPLNGTDPIQRFDLVAFSAHGSDEIQMKRVWGLPEEELQLAGGELWVDGRLLQKSLTDLQRLAVPLGGFPHGRINHWILQENDGSEASALNPEPPGASLLLRGGQVLSWRYRKPAGVHPGEVASDQWLTASRIDDDYACNQGLSYQSQPVDDFMLQLELGKPLRAELMLQLVYHDRRIEIRVPPPSPDVTPASLDSIQCKSQLTVAVCDQRLLMKSDVMERAMDWKGIAPSFPPAKPGEALVAISISSGEAQFVGLSIWRDLYLRSNGRDTAATQHFETLPADRFFVLGDNQPASLDSRNGLGAISRTQIQGIIAP